MLEVLDLKKSASDILTKRMPLAQLERVITQNTSTSDGDAALRFTLVLTPESVGKITGEGALKFLTDLHDSLERAGEERFPIVEYATSDDVEAQEE